METAANQLVTQIRALGPITPDSRAALRAAAASATLMGEHSGHFIGPHEQPQPWMTVAELAQWLRIDTQTIQAMCRNGDFGPGGAFQLSTAKGSPWRVRRSHVQAWMQDQLGGGAA